MLNALIQRLRGARHIEWFAVIVALALMALLALNHDSGNPTQKTELEQRVERVLSKIDGIGPVSAMINQDESGAVTGAVIVAERLESIGDYLRLQSAVATVLDTEITRIRIIGNGSAIGGEE